MKIAAYTLDAERLTIAEIARGDAEPWPLLVFDDQEADLDELDDRYVLARGREGGLAILDVAERRRANEARAPLAQTRRWLFAPRRRAVYVVERLEADGYDCGVRELRLDGAPSVFHKIADDFHVFDMAERDDGRLICTTKGRLAILDPDAGTCAWRAFPGFDSNYVASLWLKPRWFSPDGRFMLRPHVGSILLTEGMETGHPDLAADGVRRLGFALDVWETDPVRHVRRLVLKFVPLTDIFRRLDSPHERSRESERKRLEWIAALAQEQDWRTWDGASQLLFTPFGPETARAERERLVKRDEECVRFIDVVNDVLWEPDSRAFTAVLKFCAPSDDPKRPGPFLERRVTLDGDVGPLAPSDWSQPPFTRHGPLPSRATLDHFEALVRERTEQRIAIPDVSPPSLLVGCEEMARRMERGLDTVMHREVVRYVFEVGRGPGAKTIGEPELFAHVRALSHDAAAPLIDPLRRLMSSYGAQAKRHQCVAGAAITSGGMPEEWRAALSDAAWALAEHDDRSYEVLADWFQSVDVEHDGFAAQTVFPAIARRTRFASPDAVRFGLWYRISQWQALDHVFEDLGLLPAARRLWSPAAFAREAFAAAERACGDWGMAATDRQTPVQKLHEIWILLGRSPDAAPTTLTQVLSGEAFWKASARRALETLAGAAAE